MTDLNNRFWPTPRLLVVGLIILGSACHRQPPSAPLPSRAPTLPQTAPATPSINSASTLLQAMHDRYATSWYRTLSFTQKTTLALPSGGELVQTWYESVKLPGRLRIDTDLSSKDGTLFARDSIYGIADGKLVRSDAGSNELLLLEYDVYAQPTVRSEAQLRGLGFDLGKFHETTWQGVPVYVVGAVRGDSTSKQFWIERDRLLFVRMLEKSRQGHADTRVSTFIQHTGGWVGTEIVQLVNGKRRIREQLSAIKTNAPLSDLLFDPRQWAAAVRLVIR
jgi:hypothetical protein